MATPLTPFDPRQTALIAAGTTAGKSVTFDLTPPDLSLWPCICLNGVRTHPLTPQQVAQAKAALAQSKTLSVITAPDGRQHLGSS